MSPRHSFSAGSCTICRSSSWVASHISTTTSLHSILPFFWYPLWSTTLRQSWATDLKLSFGRWHMLLSLQYSFTSRPWPMAWLGLPPTIAAENGARLGIYTIRQSRITCFYFYIPSRICFCDSKNKRKRKYTPTRKERVIAFLMENSRWGSIWAVTLVHNFSSFSLFF